MTTDNALWDVQTALYARLTGSTALTSLFPRGAENIGDHILEETGYPRVTIGTVQSRPLGGAAFSGNETTVELEVFSRAMGMKEARVIMAEIIALLHEADFTVPHRTLVECRLVAAKTAIAAAPADNQVFRTGRLRFRILTEND